MAKFPKNTTYRIFFVSLLLAVFSLPSSLFATSRGIRIISKGGEDLFLYKDYQALVVGISDYEKWPDLPYAVSDAKEVAHRLKDLGFRVKLLLDPKSDALRRALNGMTYRMGGEKNRAVLFYYAGHGATETMADGTKMGYIVPSDCPVLGKDPIGFVTHAVSMQDIESISLRMRAKHVLMLFDSCFSGAIFALVRAFPHDITEKSALPVRQYITAGREDEEVPDQSMFKRCFLIGLEGRADMTGDGYITGSELGMYLADSVVNYTNRRQHPQYGKINNPDLDRGDFVFVPVRPWGTFQKPKQPIKAKAHFSEELARLRAEREETLKLLDKLKTLLQVQLQTQEKAKETVSKTGSIESQIAQLEKKQQTIEALADARIQEYEASLSKSKARMKKETEKRKRLETELEQARLETQESARQKAAFEAMQRKMEQESEKRKALEVELKRLREERESAASQGGVKDRPKITEKPTSSPQLKAPAPKSASKPETPQEVAAVEAREVMIPKDVATLIVTSNVPDAKVYIDKDEAASFWASPEEAWQYRGEAPFRTQSISPGIHEVRVHEEGYDEEVKIIDVVPGQTIEMDFTLFKSLPHTEGQDYGGGGGGGGGGPG